MSIKSTKESIMSEDSQSHVANNKHQYLEGNRQDECDDNLQADNHKLQKSPRSILNDHSIKLNQSFIFKLSKEIKNLKKESKESCKVIHFPSEWATDEVLTELVAFNPAEYQNLFIFIIEFKILESIDECVVKLKEQFLKFGTCRPLILQITLEDGNVSTFYYKEETSTEFHSIDLQQDTFEDRKNFPAFLCLFLNEHYLQLCVHCP